SFVGNAIARTRCSGAGDRRHFPRCQVYFPDAVIQAVSNIEISILVNCNSGGISELRRFEVSITESKSTAGQRTHFTFGRDFPDLVVGVVSNVYRSVIGHNKVSGCIELRLSPRSVSETSDAGTRYRAHQTIRI